MKLTKLSSPVEILADVELSDVRFSYRISRPPALKGEGRFFRSLPENKPGQVIFLQPDIDIQFRAQALFGIDQSPAGLDVKPVEDEMHPAGERIVQSPLPLGFRKKAYRGDSEMSKTTLFFTGRKTWISGPAVNV